MMVNLGTAGSRLSEPTHCGLRMSQKAANTEKVYYVKSSDLPISCPGPGMAIWNSHPKVYLAMGKSGEVVCEYCGAKYILKDD